MTFTLLLPDGTLVRQDPAPPEVVAAASASTPPRGPVLTRPRRAWSETRGRSGGGSTGRRPSTQVRADDSFPR